MCSIGGNVATNAGGLCCVKYGVTADFVLGLEVVLADGRALRLGGARLKDVAGLSLAKLFVGSEGTLGVITEATLRLVPAPGPYSTMVATFALLGAAADAVLDITARLRPSLLELMDHTTIAAVERHTRMGLDVSAEALLIARSDAPAPVAASEVETMAELCRARGASEVYRTDDQAEGEAFAAARRAALPAFQQPGVELLLDDVGVRLGALPDLIRGIQDIGRALDTTVAVVAHAGDGNVHPLIVYAAGDPAAAERAQRAFDAIMRLVLGLGGTITGEHGVGRLKRPWLPAQLGEDTLDVTRSIKAALDPNGILNPGCLL
jgi:glycolate oxidase